MECEGEIAGKMPGMEDLLEGFSRAAQALRLVLVNVGYEGRY